MSSDKLEKLRKLQAARRGKQDHGYSHSSDEDNDVQLYDEVDENEYKKRKRQELLQDDFVVDDDGEGYIDRGVEEAEEYYSGESDEGDNAKHKKAPKDKKKKTSVQSKNAIGSMLRAQHSKKAANLQKKTLAIDNFDDILGEFDATETKPALHRVIPARLPSSPQESFKRSQDTDSSFSNTVKRQKNDNSAAYELRLNSSPLRNQVSKAKHDITDFDDLLNDVENSPTMTKKPVSSTSTSPLKKTVPVSLDDDDDSDEELVFKKRPMRSVTTSRQVTLNPRSNPNSSPFVTAPGTPVGFIDLKNKEGSLSSNTPQTSTSEPLTFANKYTESQMVESNTGNSFEMFWLDFAEVNNSLVLYGKAKALDGTMVSAMVQINGLCRELYFLPRDGKSAADIEEEILPLLMDKYGLNNIRAKPESKKYAFELPDIPHEKEYLKVLLPYETPKCSHDLLPPDLSSDNFSHVFGGNANIVESFVVQNNVMGPCWLEIKNADFKALQNASHCAIEVAVASPRDVQPINTSDVPELNGMSISIQTVMNSKVNKQEIVAITLSKYNNISLDKPIPEDIKPESVVTLVRPPQGNNFPIGLAKLAQQKLPGTLRLFNNEKTLLSCFCAMVKVADPDVLIGHRLETVYLDILVHRIHEFKIPTFSALGRRVRKVWPDKFGKSHASMNSFFIRDLVSGRLICDIANEMGQSLTPKCQSWDLREMYMVTCNKDHKTLDINYTDPRYQDDASNLNMALQENVANSMIAAEVSFRIQLLSLTKQLTNLAGNAWSQTLGGTRAGRNEYILLHEFSKNGYIVPDKETQKMRNQRQMQMQRNEKGDEDTETTALGSSKKAKYQGGLVFEPEKGLHKNYVLVMDFNSLYPSIIQEFNICFTTVDRNLQDIDELPTVPSDDKNQGVLPRLLANLVERRREVKKVMKTEKDPHKYVQCDIRQQALKLTANSMYGCLGYVNSRFYAKPLAMLVTNKGREVLMNTRQLAETMGLVVVYGDTDSVMIDTGCESYADAIKIGENFKKLVNERYKLLEIDIDNVFKKLLLHAKKKYAALNVTINKAGVEHVKLEVKGLDMRRREFSPLSKDVSTHVLSTVLSDKDPETALQEVYEYLEDIKTKMENNEIRIDKYKINTKISKDPTAYPGGKTMPAVQVALKMRKAGKLVKAGNVITFIITKPKLEDEKSGERSHPAERAFALNDVMDKSNNLQPDPEYYLEKQIFSPVERLLERIEGFDVVRLSQALGLDSKKYLIRASDDANGHGSNSLQPLETTISDMERFKDSSNLELHCPNCSQQFVFGGVIASNFYQMCYNGLQCKKCEHIFTPIQLSCQLESIIRAHISLYYAGWLVCDDMTCGNVTRQISVFGKRCLNEGCTGVMRYRYSDKQLYNQLLYFESLFDCAKNKKQELKAVYYEGDKDYPKEKLSESSVMVLTEQNRELFEINRAVIEKYLSNCGRRYVDMGGIFDFMTN
ncbi:DNA-directed DNA polymerase alpha catalytic subunit POL1 KNAG_0I01980 [Huiozyma naganishii CBS 8797]|uniref:DNA polymerase n=1 Tax=Huiozyma naganishii (strain ATCC MYA-139 / BCRC 22969 / CBS 8797 / KCTC 17520 / NBRC 10181 / NCYC 3082 / Yp74L-3) TaxID=1071383 RepID=J7RQE1_HUIN7|nr:hypothetical protein KNAG_0I01980 [Kazachstania naganishii CBS 8797]CCK71983.1 hypothetical protein KNAG_0I01980 [Kazachstania naganishii CBS 8797]